MRFQAFVVAAMTVLQEQGATSRALDLMDCAIWAVFAIEFLLLLCFAPRTEVLKPSHGDKVDRCSGFVPVTADHARARSPRTRGPAAPLNAVGQRNVPGCLK